MQVSGQNVQSQKPVQTQQNTGMSYQTPVVQQTQTAQSAQTQAVQTYAQPTCQQKRD